MSDNPENVINNNAEVRAVEKEIEQEPVENKHAETKLEKEFELERMILFSDAVFAIAITLLILEVRFPHLPEKVNAQELSQLFKPVKVRFIAFVISFGFIGLMWAKHLQLFKYLRDYNNTIIALNLIFIFFIVCFPFTVSGFSENSHTQFSIPLFLYLSNIFLVTLAKAALCVYVLRKKSAYAIPGLFPEKRYLIAESIFTAVITGVLSLSIYISTTLFPENSTISEYVIYGFIILVFIARRYLKKFKPAKQEIKRR